MTAAEEVVELLAIAEGGRRNGLASDGRGWFRNEDDLEECFEVARSAVAALAEAGRLLPDRPWRYGAKLYDDTPVFGSGATVYTLAEVRAAVAERWATGRGWTFVRRQGELTIPATDWEEVPDGS